MRRHPILTLIAQRIALGVLLLLAVSLLIFAGTEILPGDVATSILGQAATPQALANLRAELGLNDPAPVRYFRWLGGILTGDLGTALSNRLDIATSIWPRLKHTLFLASTAAGRAIAFTRSVKDMAEWTVETLGHHPRRTAKPYNST